MTPHRSGSPFTAVVEIGVGVAGNPLAGGVSMAVDTFMAYVGVYPSVADAEADYELVKDLHTEGGS